MDTELLILKNLKTNEDYIRKVLPFVKNEYFSSDAAQKVFKVLQEYFINYNALPSDDAFKIELDNLKVGQKEHDEINSLKQKILEKTEKSDLKWLEQTTERFCKDRALMNALVRAINIADDKDTNVNISKSAIPDILSEALGVSFDVNIGHDYLESAEDRFDFYNRKVSKVPFALDSLNKITNGGVERKTLNAVIAGTNVGKSIMLCNLAASYLEKGYNVLYISMEMGEENLAQRIDANLMNVQMDDVGVLGKADYIGRINKIRAKTVGKLIFKQYPTSGASAIHFKALLRELQQKKNITPDVIIVDYLNICASATMKNKSDMYGYNKSIAEELRAIAVEYDMVVWTALQFNRAGMNNSDADITNSSESMGIAFSLDFLIALISTEELEQMGQIIVKQLKSRYGSTAFMNKFSLGLDRSKMKFYELQQTAISNQVSQASSQQSTNTLSIGTSSGSVSSIASKKQAFMEVKV